MDLHNLEDSLAGFAVELVSKECIVQNCPFCPMYKMIVVFRTTKCVMSF
jgi:hypothetical protein